MQPYQHLTLSEREIIAEKMNEGKSFRAIARELGRSPSTISREVHRNWSKGPNRYHPWRATILYITKRRDCVRRLRLTDEKLCEYVSEGLKQYWSPEIIAQRWKMENPGEKLSFATIYRALKLKLALFSGYSCKTHLRRRGKRKNISYTTPRVKPLHTLRDRPKEIEDRTRLGDLEGDTIYGTVGKGCLLTLVDRTSRFLYASYIKSRNKDIVTAGFGVALGNVHPKSITLDNGSEFADYMTIEKNHQTSVYFADPHSPWQRGSNENMNGLIRFFFPKGTDFDTVPQEAIDHVLFLINSRPRKCLGWLSPLEFINAMCCT